MTLTLASVPTTINTNTDVVVTISTNKTDSSNVAHTLTAVNGMKYGFGKVTIDANNIKTPTESL